MARKKVLLMGKAHSGKTSMRSIIFANYLARDTMRLSATLDVEHHHVRFLGDLVLNLWDCGGQDAFYESYFERDRETIFRSVELLIYVFDIASDDPEKDFDHFIGVLEAIEENSPDARIFVLVHKMDLVAKEEQSLIFEDRKRLIGENCVACGVDNFECYPTSIWDETLYKAWSEIVTNLIPNIGVLKNHLDDFCSICDADEVVLFEKATFLVVSQSHGEKQIAGSNNADVDTAPTVAATYVADSNMNSFTTGTNGTGMPSPSVTPIGGGGGGIGEDELLSVSSSAQGAMPSSIDGTNDNALPSVFSEVTGNDDTIGSSAVQGDGNITMDPDTQGISTAASSSLVRNGHPTVDMKQQQQQQQEQQQLTSTTAAAAAPTGRTSTPAHFDAHRFEKISNIVKQFKLSCEKAQSQFQGMEVHNARFSAFIDAFTANTYIMVIVSNKNVHTAATMMNIKNARRHFERLIPRT